MGEPALLASCYRSALDLAQQHRLRSIAFPAISCGVFGYPVTDAATIAVETISAHLTSPGTLESVLLIAFDVTTEQALTGALGLR
jgi:O-acetyl-ADP-ribose deacetylase (regulator of RNase III)